MCCCCLQNLWSKFFLGIRRNIWMSGTGMKSFTYKQYKQSHTDYLAVCTYYASLVASGVKIGVFSTSASANTASAKQKH